MFLRLGITLIALSGVISASPITSVVVYGDSLSDNGNLFSVAGQPGPPYFMGRRSDGPVAVEQFAAALGVPLVDFAYVGATTGIGNFGDGGTPTTLGSFGLPGMQTELAASKSSLGPLLSGGLFVVWGGPNDFLSPSPLDTTPQQVVARAVSDVLGIVTTIKGLGASNILVPGMPDLGLTPYFESLGPLASAQASALTDAFNAALRASLPPGVVFFDTSALLRSIVASPAQYGFTNVTTPCFNGTSVCSNPSQYLFFDDFHPTTAADALVARGFEQAEAPEPSTVILFGSGVFACLAFKRKLCQ